MDEVTVQHGGRAASRVKVDSFHRAIHTDPVNRLWLQLQQNLLAATNKNKIHTILLSFEDVNRLEEPATLPRLVELIQAIATAGAAADDDDEDSRRRKALMVLDLERAELELPVVTTLIAAAGASLRGLLLGRSSGGETARITPTFQAIHSLASLQHLVFDNYRAPRSHLGLRPLFSQLEECKNLKKLALKLQADAVQRVGDREDDQDDVDLFVRAMQALRVAGTLQSLTIENRGLPDSWLAPLAQAARELQPLLVELDLYDRPSVSAFLIRGHFDDETSTEPVVFQDNKQVWLRPERASLLYQGAEGMPAGSPATFATLDDFGYGADDDDDDDESGTTTSGGHATKTARLVLTGRGALQGAAVTQLAESLPRMRHLTSLRITDYQEDEWSPHQQLQLYKGLHYNTSLTRFFVRRGPHTLAPMGVEPVLQRNRDLANVQRSFLANNKEALQLAACPYALATLGRHELGETPALVLLRSQMGAWLDSRMGSQPLPCRRPRAQEESLQHP